MYVLYFIFYYIGSLYEALLLGWGLAWTKVGNYVPGVVAGDKYAPFVFMPELLWLLIKDSGKNNKILQCHTVSFTLNFMKV